MNSSSLRWFLFAAPCLSIVTALMAHSARSKTAYVPLAPAPALAPHAAPAQAAAPAKAAKPVTVALTKDAVTYDKIAPILYSNCSSCHRAGEVAPFALMGYADAKKRAKQIAMVTQQRFMPPWKADEGREKFADAHRLTDEEIALLGKWAAAGAPEGDKAKAPKPPVFASGWQNGTPDVVLQPDAPYQLAAEGDDVYRCFVIPTNYDTDRYIAAMEVRPGTNTVVHHVIAYLDASGGARKLDERDPGPGYTSFGGIGVVPGGMIGGWAPGNVPHLAATGNGVLLPKGTDIVLQVHYHKSGKPENDLTKIGLFFAKGPVDKRIRSMMVVNPLINIPAGNNEYIATASKTITRDVTALGVTPHMHLLGKDMQVTATLPDGTVKKLVHVDDWDFNWQTSYAFKEPIKLPAGTRIDLSARYDNSTNNPTNPTSPPRAVTWGEQTTDEMCIAFVAYTVDKEHLTQEAPALQTPPTGGGRGMGDLSLLNSPLDGDNPVSQFLKTFDKNGNNKLDPDEKTAVIKWWMEHNPGKQGG